MATQYKVDAIQAFNDNYIWAIHKDNNDNCIIVDPGSADEVLRFLADNNMSLIAILITHHHRDHIGGVSTLLAHFPNVPVYGPSKEAMKSVTHPLTDGEEITISALGITLNVIEVPGHTLGHIAYVDSHSLFCGDTLFSGGCGRMFEGTPQMFSSSLSKLSTLPSTTLVYCAHEYTLSNLTFAKAVSPNSSELEKYIEHCEKKRARNLSTIPSSINTELAINPFLRLQDPDVINALNSKFSINLNT
ncbi:MAG: hydroxyacylglutathione hydrolase, partial [Psychrobium sp.]